MEDIKNCEGCEILPYLQAKGLPVVAWMLGEYIDSQVRDKGLYYSGLSRQHEFQFHIHSPCSLSPTEVMPSECYIHCGFVAQLKNLKPKEFRSFRVGCKNTA